MAMKEENISRALYSERKKKHTSRAFYLERGKRVFERILLGVDDSIPFGKPVSKEVLERLHERCKEQISVTGIRVDDNAHRAIKAKKVVSILRAFYREQEKEIPIIYIHPDDSSKALKMVLRSASNPFVHIAKQKNLGLTTVDGDRVVVINPDNSRTFIGKVESKDIPVTERTISFGQQ
jgi:uncharacterized protein (UPF0248 family)